VQAGLARRSDLLACGQQVLVERGVVMQAGHGGGAHEAAFEDVALPVHVAHQAALAVVAAAGLDGIGAVGAISDRIRAQAQPIEVWPDG
jgi:hypothetical protein